MTSKAQQAFEDIGFDEADRHNAMQRLKYLEKHDPEMLQLIMGRCSDSAEEAELWRSWFSVISPKYNDEEPNADHLAGYRMRYELYPTALEIAKKLNLKTYVIEVMVGSSWQFGERTGSEWDMMRAHMLAVTVVPYFGSDDKESMKRVKFVAEHFDQIMEMLPSLVERGNLTVDELRMIIHGEEPEEETEE